MRLRLLSRLSALVGCVVVCVPSLGADNVATTDDSSPIPPAEFAHHVEVTLTELMRTSPVPGATFAIVHDGKVAATGAAGYADRESRRRAVPATLFNVGSISKTVTAWGVIRLAEQGRIDLNAPVDRYLTRWHLPRSTFGTDGVTVERLLAHTAGISMPSVTEYAPSAVMPTLVQLLQDSTLAPRQIREPGTAFAYSGGGYMILQLMIEDVTGQDFCAYMRDAVLHPLGMLHSTFCSASEHDAALATPYDSAARTPVRRYVGLAPAGLYSTAEDLGRFVAATMRGPNGEPPGRGVISPASLTRMLAPAPNTEQDFGIREGLGYALWPITGGALLPGHLGQNIGWGAVIWLSPLTGDGLVVLTNHSDGFDLYRNVLCDWVAWQARPSWAGSVCRGRTSRALGPLGSRLYATPLAISLAPRDPFVDSLFQATFTSDKPGAAVVVVKNGRTVHRAAYGFADVASERRVTPSTAFYLASVSKQFTATAVALLVQQGKLRYDDPISRYVSDLPRDVGAVTIRQLLTHTSGIADYNDLITRWNRVQSLDNAVILDSLRHHATKFPPGSRYDYSNSNYVLLAEVIERVSHQRYSRFLDSALFRPAGMAHTWVADRGPAAVRSRAIGYSGSGDSLRLDDFGAADIPGVGRYYIAFSIVGPGGIYSSAEDLERWDAALANGRVLPIALQDSAYIPRVAAPTETGIPGVLGYAYGWVVSERNGRRLIWHDGSFAGFRSIIVRLPREKSAVIILANSGAADLHAEALRIIDRVLQ